MKGAPEIIINMCGDVAKKADYTEKLDQWQRRCMRTLALAYMVVGADAAARVAFAPIEIPVGVFMSFLGAPFFLYLLRQGMQRGR